MSCVAYTRLPSSPHAAPRGNLARTDGDGRPACDRHFLQRDAVEEAHPIAVGREERRPGRWRYLPEVRASMRSRARRTNWSLRQLDRMCWPSEEMATLRSALSIEGNCSGRGTISKRAGRAPSPSRGSHEGPHRQRGEQGTTSHRRNAPTCAEVRGGWAWPRPGGRDPSDVPRMMLVNLQPRVPDGLQPLLRILLQASGQQRPCTRAALAGSALPVGLLAEDRDDRVGDILAAERARVRSASRRARSRTPRHPLAGPTARPLRLLGAHVRGGAQDHPVHRQRRRRDGSAMRSANCRGRPARGPRLPFPARGPWRGRSRAPSPCRPPGP